MEVERPGKELEAPAALLPGHSSKICAGEDGDVEHHKAKAIAVPTRPVATAIPRVPRPHVESNGALDRAFRRRRLSVGAVRHV